MMKKSPLFQVDILRFSKTVEVPIQELYCGDNYSILCRIPSDSIPLIYIDPPFFTQSDKNDYMDKWDSLEQYLQFMEIRIQQLYRILHSNGTFYLHCDHHCSHYLKILCDKIFGYSKFRNEIIWCYNNGGGIPELDFPRKHDNIFRYTKSEQYYFNPPTHKMKGNGWRHDKTRYKPNEDDTPIPDWWGDISPLHSHAKEKDYSTQKPVSLLERIITTSSKQGDCVLDCFMGGGTTLYAAKKLNRGYIGIDQSIHACQIVARKLNMSVKRILKPKD